MPKGKYVGDESTIPLRGIVRGGQLVGIIDQDGAERGIALVDKNKVTGGLETSAGGVVINGTLKSGEWATPPSIFRFLMNGTGKVTVDSKDASGVITLGVFSQTLVGAVNLIGFPFAGESAISIRATLTGTAKVEVI